MTSTSPRRSISPGASAIPLLTELILVGLVAVGPVVDDRNRLSGLLSLGVVISLTVMLLVARDGAYRIAIVTSIGGTLLGCVGLLVARPIPGHLLLNAIHDRVHLEALPALAIHPNVLAYLLLPAPIALSAIAVTAAKRRERIILSLFAAIGIVVVLLTGSRLSGLAMGAGLACLALFSRRRAIALAGMLLVVAMSAASILSPANLEARESTWMTAIRAIVSSPAFISGYGSLAYEVDDSTYQVIGNGENTYLQSVADFGPLGAAALFALALAAARRCLTINKSGEAHVVSIGRACFAAVVALSVAGAGESVVSTQLYIDGAFVTILSPVPFVVLTLPFVGIMPRARTSQPGVSRGIS